MSDGAPDLDTEILRLLYLNYDQERIAHALFISRSTIQRRIRQLMLTLDASGPVALGAEAARRGLLPSASDPSGAPPTKPERSAP